MDDERNTNQVGCLFDVVFLIAVVLIGFFGLCNNNGDQTSVIVKLLMAYFIYKVITKWTKEVY